MGLPKLCVVLLGGFTTNFIWCVILNVRNRTGYQYFSAGCAGTADAGEETIVETALDAPGEEVVEGLPRRSGRSRRTGTPAGDRVPMLGNYFFSALAGVTWYLQFFFYTMGETQMGKYKFSSWTLHMASIILFSSLWGIALKEWKGSSGRTRCACSPRAGARSSALDDHRGLRQLPGRRTVTNEVRACRFRC